MLKYICYSLAFFVVLSKAETAILYDYIDFTVGLIATAGKRRCLGSSIKIEFNGCQTLPREWNDRASSINTYGTCIQAWVHGSCQGKSTLIRPGTPSHNNLASLGINDEISSISPCSPSGGVTIPQRPNGDWKIPALNLHNEYRAKHGVPPLRLDDELNRSAQKCAEYLASNRIFDHACKNALSHSYGENLAKRYEDDSKTAALEATKTFYSEESKHDYNSNYFQYQSGHFSQLVWKNSQKLGLGFATNGDFKVVVAHYDPPGNYERQFLQMSFVLSVFIQLVLSCH